MTLPELIWGAVLVAGLAALAWVDARTFRLPDILTLPLLCAGLFQSWHLTGQALPSAIGAIGGYLIFVAVEVSFRALRGKDGLGRGDAKLLAAGGAWCTWMGIPWIVLIASSTGLLFAGTLVLVGRKPLAIIPFGPFLVIGILVVWAARIVGLLP